MINNLKSLLLARGRDRLETEEDEDVFETEEANLLLARGRDRLETTERKRSRLLMTIFSYSLGDAIDWKQCFFQS